MITLASVAFVLAGLLLAVYAVRFTQVVRRRLKQPINSFGYGYICLSAAFLIWGIASASESQSLLTASVIVGNVCLLVGSVFMLQVAFHGNKFAAPGIAIGSLGAVAFLIWRIMLYPPQPEMANGLLLFHTPPAVTVVLGLIIAGIWLPASLKVAKALTSAPKLKPMRQTYFAVYSMATAGALLFLSAKTPILVTLTFASIVLCFVMLMATTLLVDNLGKKA